MTTMGGRRGAGWGAGGVREGGGVRGGGQEGCGRDEGCGGGGGETEGWWASGVTLMRGIHFSNDSQLQANEVGVRLMIMRTR